VNRPEILEKVKGIVSKQLEVKLEDLNENTSFVNDLNADSLDSVEVVMNLEDEFDITVPDEKSIKILTIKDAVDVLEEII
jgi:acyl carrier protein